MRTAIFLSAVIIATAILRSNGMSFDSKTAEGIEIIFLAFIFLDILGFLTRRD